MEWEKIAKRIDAALLRADSTRGELTLLAEEASSLGYRGVCVPPYLVTVAKQLLEGTGIRTCAVIGFPFGYSSLAVKLYEVGHTIRGGADDVDYVVNLSSYFSDGPEPIMVEADNIVAEAKSYGEKVVKAIIEVGHLNKMQLTELSQACASSGVDYLKTSTGFGPRGVTVEDVRTMLAATNGRVPVKAAGGIGNLKQALEILEAGASIIGTSHGREIVQEARGKGHT